MTIKTTVRQTIGGKYVHTQFKSEDAARTFANAVGGKVLPPKTSFADALAKAIREAGSR